MELMRIRANAGRVISGTPEIEKAELEKLAASFGIDEIVVTTMAGYEERRRSFELLAEAFALTPREENNRS